MPGGWVRLLAASVLALAGWTAPAQVAAGAGAGGQGEPLDAELLRDLDILNNADYVRDREMLRRMRLLERLRMLESLRTLESQTAPTPTTGSNGSSPKEVK